MPAPSCRDCGASLRFVLMADSGKSLPVNPIADPTGNVAARKLGGRLTAGYVIARDRPLKAGFELYRPHRADCKPNTPRGPRPAHLF